MNMISLMAAVLDDLEGGETGPAIARLSGVAAPGGAVSEPGQAPLAPCGEARVALWVEVCTVEEALTCAVMLMELGRWDEAADVVQTTVTALIGVAGVPLGAQRSDALAA